LVCVDRFQPTQFYDWELHFAEEGFLVLASKVRLEAEVETVQKCLEKIFKRQICPENLYDLSDANKSVTRKDVLAILNATSNEDIVWTRAAVRMAVITLHSLRFECLDTLFQSCLRQLWPTYFAVQTMKNYIITIFGMQKSQILKSTTYCNFRICTSYKITVDKTFIPNKKS
jgi:hypothetical protein